MKKQEPFIDRQKLKKLVEKNYDFEVKSFKFIHKGADADAYLIETKENKKFIVKIYDLRKIKRLHLDINFNGLLALSIMHKDHGIDRISYPILTNRGKLYVSYKNYRLIIYNFIKGKNDEKQLTKPQLKSLAELLAQIHKLPEKIKKKINKQEEFTERYLKEVILLIKKLRTLKYPSKYQKRVLKLINPNLEKINAFVEDTRETLRKVKIEKKNYMVCHTDAYFLNLVKNGEEVYIIDWDGIKLATREGDLWFYLVRNICKTPDFFLKYYKKVYGRFKLNKQLIHFYIQQTTIRDFMHYLREIIIGKESEFCLKEIKGYILKWIFNMNDMLKDVDKTIDGWNKK